MAQTLGQPILVCNPTRISFLIVCNFQIIITFLGLDLPVPLSACDCYTFCPPETSLTQLIAINWLPSVAVGSIHDVVCPARTCAEESDIFALAGAEATRDPQVASGQVILHLVIQQGALHQREGTLKSSAIKRSLSSFALLH